MIVGTTREIKTEEYRVGLTPDGVRDLVRHGHRVLVEAGAGVGSGYSDEAYRAAGAEVLPSAADVWAGADLIVKVKEPQPPEFALMRPDLTLFTYLHLATTPDAADALLRARTTSIAYETVALDDGSLPLLIPMSEIAGRLAPEVAAQYLRKPGPGRGKLMSGMPGVPSANVVIFGAGTVGRNAAAVALGMGARVTVLAPRLEELREIEGLFPNRVVTLPSTPSMIDTAIVGADVLISGVLVRGGRLAPKLVSREDLRTVGPGAVIVDVAIDQGGIFETSRPTTHADPIYVEEGVVHYCVANMPGAVPRTATAALTAATMPYVLKLADLGISKALAADPALARGLMTRGGELVNRDVAQTLGK
ncbi:MAG TPA: alanine dehydrogenase [Dehalococcoidia bacterium]|nr:alanine dehydrogenase [Dehalococcoidia bacterium]